MISQTLRNVFVTRCDRGLADVFVTTDGGVYQIDGDGFSRVADQGLNIDAILPDAFKGKRVVEARCNGEDIAIRLEDGSYISSGWQIDTRSGGNYRDVLFHGTDDVDADFLEFYEQLLPCEERQSE